MSEQEILKTYKETEKVKVGTFEFEDGVADAEIVLAFGRGSNQPLKKIDRLTRYRFNSETRFRHSLRFSILEIAC